MDMSWETIDLQSPNRQLIPGEDFLLSSDLLVPADKLLVYTKAKESSMDGLIDYTISLNIDDPTWKEQSQNAALLVIHTILQPLQTLEPINWY